MTGEARRQLVGFGRSMAIRIRNQEFQHFEYHAFGELRSHVEAEMVPVFLERRHRVEGAGSLEICVKMSRLAKIPYWYSFILDS